MLDCFRLFCCFFSLWFFLGESGIQCWRHWTNEKIERWWQWAGSLLLFPRVVVGFNMLFLQLLPRVVPLLFCLLIRVLWFTIDHSLRQSIRGRVNCSERFKFFRFFFSEVSITKRSGIKWEELYIRGPALAFNWDLVRSLDLLFKSSSSSFVRPVLDFACALDVEDSFPRAESMQHGVHSTGTAPVRSVWGCRAADKKECSWKNEICYWCHLWGAQARQTGRPHQNYRHLGRKERIKEDD